MFGILDKWRSFGGSPERFVLFKLYQVLEVGKMKKHAILVLAVALAAPFVGNTLATVLDITPVEDFEPSGQVGGPFTPASKDYQLTNTGPNSLWWGVYITADWLEVDPELGPLEPNESTIVVVSLTPDVNLLPEGDYNDTLTFLDFTNDEEQTRGVALSITTPNALEVTPAEDFEPSGEVGGPFTPSSKDYQLTNNGANTIWWGAYETAEWLEVDPELGPLEPNESTIVTVSLTSQAYSLLEGVHIDTLTFHDFTNGEEQTRGVTLTITAPGGIWVSPTSFDVNVVEGLTLTETMTIGNNGLEDLDFTIRTRVVGGSGASMTRAVGKTAASKTGLFNVPENHDFTVLGDSAYKPGELIVRFAAKANGNQLSATEKNQILTSVGGGTVQYEFKIVLGLSVVKLPAGMTVEEALKTFNKANGVLYAEPNYQVKACSTFPNDPRFDDLWGMHNTGQTGGTPDADIDAPEAWEIATGSSEIIVAVIDTGVDYTHPDLAGNMWVNEAEYYGTPGVDDDGNGYVDDIYGYDFCNYDGDPMDDHYHGTHCSGTVGALGDNGEGVAGVCWNVSIMALKFLDAGGGGWTDDAINCVEYSVLMGANLSSNSWGGGGYSQSLKDAIDAAGAAGMLFAAAAGNDYGQNNDVYPHYPSSYDCESLISVMSTNDNDNRSSFSNYGPTSVDLGAPGSDILSCKLGGGYKYASGTSMATPHVAGACALLWSMNPVLSNSEVKDIILQTVDPTLPGLCVSEGRLNLYSAILETRAPWIEIEPEEGTVGAGDSNEVSVIFNTVGVTPGTYEAEIIIMSNDACSPTKIVPVTMTVNPDDLAVVPAEDFESSGTKGGPFEPQCATYTLTNNGTSPVNWTTFEVEDWLEVDPNEGMLDPCQSIDVNVCISLHANSLDPNIYTQILTFQNTDSNSIKLRSITLTVKPPDCFTESFGESGSDLGGLTITFSPDGSIAYYEACRERTSGFPTDPNGATYLSIADDDFVEVILSGGAEVLFYGQCYDRFYIGSNGYITFGQGDTEYTDTLENHFNMPRISGLFTDLTPADNNSISFKQLDDRVVATFEDVPLYGDKTTKNSFQVEIFFVDGSICITWLDLAATTAVAGLSEGKGLPPAFFFESDLNQYPACWPVGDFSRDYLVNFSDFAVLAAYWLEADCNIPFWCGKSDLDFSGKTDFNDLAIFVGNWLTKEDWWLQPISHWKFDEGEGTTAYDSVGSNHGTLVNGPVWTSGQINGALDFDGDDDYVDVGDPVDGSLDFGATDSFSISVWVKTAEDGQPVYKQRITGDGYREGYKVRVYFEKLYFGMKDTSNNGTEIFGSTTVTNNEWHHVVAVRDTVEDKVYLYLDGTSDATPVTDNTIESLATSRSLEIARGAGVYYYTGKIDDVRIYDRALSAEEVQQLYEEGLGNKAFNPNPSDGASFVDPNTALTWSPGKDALSHDVYIGTDYNDVNDANTADPNVYMGNQDANHYDPCGLDLQTTYYWRIDEVSASSTCKGNIWSFTTWGVFDPNLGLISWWMFDEGAETTAYDSAGDNDGTLVGDPVWTIGQIGGALDFDGDGDYVDVGDPVDGSLDFGAGDSFSIVAWIITGATNGRIVDKRRCTGTGGVYYEGYGLRVLQGKLSFAVEDISSNVSWLDGDSMVTDDQWHHVATVRDVTTDRLYLYLDGSTDATPVTDISIDTLDTDKGFDIGHAINTTTGHGYFDGKIDDVRIYERALSAEEVLQLYLEGAGPISHWTLDEGAGTTAYDSAGDNDGTLYGDANWVDGQVGSHALEFDGDGDYVDVGNDSSLKPPLPLTLSAWISFSQNGATIVSLDDWSSTYNGVVLDLNAASHVSVSFGDGYGGGGPSHRRSKTGSAVLNADTWYHAAAVVRDATDMELYVNGVDDGGSYSGSGGSLAYSSGNASIATAHSAGIYFDGKIDDVRVYDRSLSAEEVWLLYQDGLN
jgi:subtilisin family serine protease